MKTKRMIAMAGLLAATAVPFFAGGTASASESVNGCTITASQPEWQPLSNGTKQVRALAFVHCSGQRSVSVQQQVLEADSGGLGSDDVMVNTTWGPVTTLQGGRSYAFRTGWGPCKNTEAGNEEAYVRARIIVSGSSPSAWDSGRSGLQLSIAC